MPNGPAWGGNVGGSAPPTPLLPEVAITQAPFQVKGISATPGFHGTPPPIDPVVAAIRVIGQKIHGTG